MQQERFDGKRREKKTAENRTSIREFSVRLSFENQAWRDATPFLLFVSVEVGDFNGSDKVVNDFDFPILGSEKVFCELFAFAIL